MTPEQIKSRVAALSSYIQSFTHKLKLIENIDLSVDFEEAADNICSLYERYTEEVVRPTITSGIIQHYKIIANTELATLRISPIHTGDQKKDAWLNARLAFHIALSMLIDWNKMDDKKLEALIKEDRELQSFIQEHIAWLSLLDSRYYFPIFSNSQVWRLFHYLVRDRLNLLDGDYGS